MFYLLYDNRIIDSNVSYTKVLPFWEEKEGRLFAKCKSGKSYQVFKYDKIKKQSENVFDLIEEGDLVENFSTISQVIKIINNTVITSLDIPFDVSLIIKIYKPDEKGNYIKVWERKDE